MTRMMARRKNSPDHRINLRLNLQHPVSRKPVLLRKMSNSSNSRTAHQGQLILDATVVEQAIRYPTDLSLLNEAREFSEQSSTYSAPT